MLASIEPVTVAAAPPSELKDELDGNLDQRLTELLTSKAELEVLMDSAVARRDFVVSQRESLTSYEEFLVPVSALHEEVGALLATIEETLVTQHKVVSEMASAAVESRLGLVKQYLTTARYELAKTYDLIADKERNETP